MTDDVHAHAQRARDISIADFHFVMLPDGVLTDRSGRRYLTYARSGGATKRGARLDESVAAPLRRLVAWALYTLCATVAATALWFVFVEPCSCAVPEWSLDRFTPTAPLRAPTMNALARVP